MARCGFGLYGAALLTLAWVAAPEPAQSGAWTQKKGEGLVIVTLAHSEADQRFDAIGAKRDQKDFRKTELRSYVEYGLTDWATLLAQPEWRIKEIGDGPGEQVSGFGRADIGLRLRLWQKKGWVGSVQGSVRAPGGGDPLAPANGGDTEWELDGRLLLGRGMQVLERNAFFDMQLGYRHRFGDPADELRLDLTSGIDVMPKLLAMVQSFNSVSIGTPQGDFLSTREHKIAASAVWRVDESWSLQIGGLMTPSGQNAIDERGLFVSVWRKF